MVNLSGGDNATAINVLTKLYTWVRSCGGDINQLSFITEELESRLKGLGSLLDALQLTTAGENMCHRLAVPGEDMGAYTSTISLISTHYKVSTDNCSKFQRGEDDYYVFFQPCFHYIFSYLRFCDSVSDSFMVKIREDHCTHLLPEVKFVSSNIINYNRPYGIEKLFNEMIDIRSLYKIIREANVPYGKDLCIIPSRELGLTAFLSAKFCQYVKSYKRGVIAEHRNEVVNYNASSYLNITLIRQVDLAALLKSIVCLMSFDRLLSKYNSPNMTREYLELMSSHPSGNIDYGQFQILLEAITTAGRLSELATLAKKPPHWANTAHDKSFLNILLLAMKNSMVCHEKLVYQVFY